MRRSLLVRMIGLSLVVAVCSIAATAWLTTRQTTESIQGGFDRTLEADGFVYRELLTYAQTHDSWADVEEDVDTLADETGRRITVTTPDGNILADSADVSTSLPPNAAAEIDPLTAGPTIEGSEPVIAGAPMVGSMIASPTWRLTETEHTQRVELAEEATTCVQSAYGDEASVVLDPSGVVYVWSSDDAVAFAEEPAGLSAAGGGFVSSGEATELGPTGADAAAVEPCLPTELTKPSTAALAVQDHETALLSACLDDAGIAYSTAETELGQTVVPAPIEDDETMADASVCAEQARTTALDPYVADRALLYIDSSGRLDAFTGQGWWRVALTAVAVLAVAAGVTVLAGRRLVRPIQALTDAARRMTTGDRSSRVPVRGQDEVAQLGHAFNAMADSVEAGERQRQAMVSDVAHELRTPLANVRGYLEAAQDGVVTLDRELVASLLEESRLLQRLVDDLQDLALADAGMLALHPEDCDATELARQVVAAHQSRAVEAGVDLSLDGDRPAVLVGDAMRLRQAVGNLVGNAVQYTPAGGTVRVWAELSDDEVRVNVSDTGPGIPADALPRIFDRFYRVDQSRTRSTGGSGLGLAITKQLVEMHGGTVSVSSVEGEGTTFTIQVPASGARLVRTPAAPATHV